MEIFWLGYIGIIVVFFFKFLIHISDVLIEIRKELEQMNKKE